MPSSQEKPGLDSSVTSLPRIQKAPDSSYDAKRTMALVGTLLEREYAEIEFGGKILYVFDMGLERGKRQAIILHSENHLSDSDFTRNYPEMVRDLMPANGEAKIHIIPQKDIDYLLKNTKKKFQEPKL